MSVRTYLASPVTSMQCQAAIDSRLPVLISFACSNPTVMESLGAFSRVLIDSGAYSALNSGVKVSLEAYVDFAASVEPYVDAIAGLDDISGDWRKSMSNYEKVGFPTIHDTDPEGLLDDLIPLARERGGWIGIGLLPPRQGKEAWLRKTMDAIPEDVHIHGWALREYLYLRRMNSVDSTNWWRDGLQLKGKLPWLTSPECLNLVCLRYEREHISLKMREQFRKEKSGDGIQEGIDFKRGTA